MQMVRIIDHGDGTYSAWIYATCYVSHGTLAERMRQKLHEIFGDETE